VQVHSFDEFLALGKANPAPPVPPSPEDYCTIMYTSGTTGDPKVSAWPMSSLGAYCMHRIINRLKAR
jgi:long-subunit acyl-CoA synthetase (AMP-forming)